MKDAVNERRISGAMAQHSVAMNDVLAAVSGNDDALARELRGALVSQAIRYAEVLKAAETAEDWHAAARRLASLAASFCVADLQAAARAAQGAPLLDPAALRKISRAISNLYL
jgi:HPt (histidine-containing phosphotransfer) domain-containing protein